MGYDSGGDKRLNTTEADKNRRKLVLDTVRNRPNLGHDHTSVSSLGFLSVTSKTHRSICVHTVFTNTIRMHFHLDPLSRVFSH